MQFCDKFMRRSLRILLFKKRKETDNYFIILDTINKAGLLVLVHVQCTNIIETNQINNSRDIFFFFSHKKDREKRGSESAGVSLVVSSQQNKLNTHTSNE